MAARRSTFPIAETQGANFDHAWIRALVTAIDDRLRLRYGVKEFSRSQDCIFRIQISRANESVVLSDGTRVHAGDPIIDLHFWNEHVPLMPPRGPTLAWARQMNRALDISLSELAELLRRRKDLDDVVAIRGNMKLGETEQSDQLARISGRYGFERIPARPPASLGERLHRLGEDIFIAMIVLARNAAAFRFSGLWRDCTVVFLSRRSLMQRYKLRSHLRD